jgi:hypothetical protein
MKSLDFYQFTYAGEDGRCITSSFEVREGDDETWGSVVEHFQNFLRGCGFIFDVGFDFNEVLQQKHKETLSKLCKSRCDNND